MASLWQHPKSKYWTACYTDRNGRQIKRSTKKINRTDALTVALEYQRAENAARDGVLTEAQCRKVLSEILEKTTGESVRHVSTQAFLSEWLDSYSTKPGTRERYENTVELFLKHIQRKAGLPITGIAPRDIQSFLDARMKNGCAPKTVIVDAKTLNTAFNRARRHGIITNNPVEAVSLPPLESSERETFTSGQVAMLVTSAKGDWKTAILLGYYTGARLHDCVTMNWSNVDLTTGVIAYSPEKTRRTTLGKKVVIPIHPELDQHFMALAGSDKSEGSLCPTLAEKSSGGAHGLSAGFKAIMRNAGIDSGTGKGKGARQFSKLSFHSLRHSFNSALANAGVSQELRMKLTGHKCEQTNDGYTHHELEPLRSAVEKLPSLTSDSMSG